MKTKKLLAYHGDPKIKELYIKRVKAHQKADRIIKGKYWEDGKGCAVGCTIEGNEHSKYETELGIPEILARLEDGLFEEMFNEEAMKFPLRFLEAIPVGADLSKVFTKLVIWEWEDPTHGLKNIKEIADDKELVDCCEKVVKLYKKVLAGKKVKDDEWIALEQLVDKIYYAGAGATATAGAWATAWAGAEYEKQISITAEKLLDLLKESK